MMCPSPLPVCRRFLPLLFLAAAPPLEAQEVNVADQGIASQSTEWNGGQYPAENAIDGNTGTFSHTDSDTIDNHWLLAFPEERALQRIEIVAREDCCAGRLTNAMLRVLDDDGESIFDAAVTDPGQGESAFFTLPPGTFGKSVRIGFEDGGTNPQGNRNLHLGEVRIFGDASRPVAIDFFTVSTARIQGGEPVVLQWATSGAESVEIPGIGVFPATGQTTVFPARSTEFTLFASTASGTAATALATVVVDGTPLPLAITEFMAAPEPDGFAGGEDWIEMHNPNAEAASLDGYRLTDTRDQSMSWTFPAGVSIPANGFLVVRATGEAAGNGADGVLETTFRLAREPDSYLALLGPGGAVASEFIYPEQRRGVSFGTAADGSPRYFTQPTPQAVNGAGWIGFVGDTRFSTDRGFYSQPFSLEITTATAAATILVTLDGTRPGPGNASAFAYDGPLEISGTTIVRAAAYLDGFLPTNVDTQSYLFVADVLRQPQKPDGFPSSWGDGPGVQARLPAESDYAMDSRIVEAAPFADLHGDAFGWDEVLQSIPSMSLVLPIAELLDPDTGLHAQARNRGRAWERQASLEIIDPVLGTSVQANCGLRMQGGWNRFPEMLKKSMRLYFRGEYGDGKLRYPLFADSTVTEFDRLVLRSGNGKAWPSPWRALSGGGNSLTRTTYLRDQFVRDSQRDLGHPTAHGNFVHLYVNGLYWGLYNSVERLDEKFAVAHFGGNENDYDIVKWIRGLGGLQLVAGSTDAWVEMRRRARLPMDDPDNYQAVLELLDPVSLIDYMIANMYAGNIDWQDNNAYAIRNGNLDAGGDGKWRFFSWDGEETFLSTGQDSTIQNVANTATEIYTRLQRSEDFRVLFADRLYAAFFNEGPLSPEGADARWARLAQWIDRAVVGESARWGDLMRPAMPYDHDDWEREILNLRSNYAGVGKAGNRTKTTLAQFARRGFFPDLQPPVVLPIRGGTVAPGQLVRLENPEGQDATLYFTTDGTDPRAPGGAVSASAQAFTGGAVPSLVIAASSESAPGSVWSYLDTGEDLSNTDWTLPQYDDSGWASGPSELGYGDRNENTVTGYGADPGSKFITTYFRHTFDLAATGASSPGKVTRLRARILFDDGAVVYLNGTEIARLFLPEGVIGAQTPALEGGDENVFVEIPAIDPGLLVAGLNTVAVEVHQVSRTNSDISFDLEWIADSVAGNVPAGVVVDAPLQLKARSFDGENWSALEDVSFAVFTPGMDGLAISEIHYAPGAGNAADAEFIELVNRGDAPVELGGLRFTEGIAFTFAARTLAPGARVLVVRDRAAFDAAFPGVPELLIAGTFAENTALNNGGERLVLTAADGSRVTGVDYGAGFPWPAEAGGDGYSLTWIEGADPGLPESWRGSVAPGGSPGTGDALPAPPPEASAIAYALAADPEVEVHDGKVWLHVSTVPGADAVTLVIEQSADLVTWTPRTDAQRVSRSRSTPSRIDSTYLLGPAAQAPGYLRLRAVPR